MTATRAELSTAIGVAGLGVFQLAGLWQNTAPSLSTLRNKHPEDWEANQHLQDADYLVGGLSVLVAVSVWYLTRDVFPAMLVVLGFLVLSGWYHSVKNAHNG